MGSVSLLVQNYARTRIVSHKFRTSFTWVADVPCVARDPSRHRSGVVERPIALLQLIQEPAQPEFFKQVFSHVHLNVEPVEIVKSDSHFGKFRGPVFPLVRHQELREGALQSRHPIKIFHNMSRSFTVILSESVFWRRLII